MSEGQQEQLRSAAGPNSMARAQDRVQRGGRQKGLMYQWPGGNEMAGPPLREGRLEGSARGGLQIDRGSNKIRFHVIIVGTTIQHSMDVALGLTPPPRCRKYHAFEPV